MNTQPPPCDPTGPRPLDAVADGWVERMPGALQPYLRLARLDRPAGAWLLLLPCWWGLALAQIAQPGALSVGQTMITALLFAPGALVMRAAGCVYNDIVDADLDARVARTAGRPIPAGLVTRHQAWLLLVGLALAGLLVLVQFNRATILAGIASLGLVAAYPFMKRMTWWPQAWLGLTFNWGIWLGWTAVHGGLAPAPAVLYLGALFWTLAYDTIYALQDREDDALAGIRSSARVLGERARPAIGLFFVLALLLIATAAGLAGGRSGWRLAVLLPALLHGLWQTLTLQSDMADNCLVRFRSNRDFGLLVLAALAVLAWARATG